MARILLVEDNPEQLELRESILVQAGFEVVTAATFAEAMERRGGCDVAVIDLIPQSEELLRQLDADVRVIVLSGREPDRMSLPRQVDEVLVKPCPTRKLIESISHLCARACLVLAAVLICLGAS